MFQNKIINDKHLLKIAIFPFIKHNICLAVLDKSEGQ